MDICSYKRNTLAETSGLEDDFPLRPGLVSGATFVLGSVFAMSTQKTSFPRN